MNSALIVIILLAVAFGLFYISKQQSAEMVTPGQFRELMESNPGVVIDVRTANEHTAGHLEITDHNFDVMSGQFNKQLKDLDRDRTYYLYCRTGNRSGKAARIMKSNGFEEVYNIGGFRDLAEAGFETKP